MKEIVKLPNINKKDELYYESKRRKANNVSEYSLPIISFKDIHEGYWSLKDTDDEQRKFANKFKSIDEGIRSIEKKLFLSNIGLFFTARENVFKIDYFQ